MMMEGLCAVLAHLKSSNEALAWERYKTVLLADLRVDHAVA